MGTDDDIAVVRANSAAFSDRDVDTMLSCYAPDAVVADQRRHGLGTFTGHDELRPYYLSIFHAVDAMREQLEVPRRTRRRRRLPLRAVGAAALRPQRRRVQRAVRHGPHAPRRAHRA